MRNRSVYFLGLLLGSGLSVGQQSVPLKAAEPGAPPPQPPIHYADPDIVAPELLPVRLTDAATGRCHHLDGTVVLSAVVDASGVPSSIYLLAPAGNDLDKQAIRVLAAERFKPGKRNGIPVAVGVDVEMDMMACIEEKTNNAGQKILVAQLRSIPAQKLEIGWASPEEVAHAAKDTLVALPDASDHPGRDATVMAVHPKLLKYVDPDIPDDFLRKGRNGTCLVGLTVDVNGMPQDVHVVRSFSPDLDQSALNAVRRYRFKPAMKDGTTPVAVKITVEVDFQRSGSD